MKRRVPRSQLFDLAIDKCVAPAASGRAARNIATQEPNMRMLGMAERNSDRVRTDLGTDGPH
jgi:hypothetical protein